MLVCAGVANASVKSRRVKSRRVTEPESSGSISWKHWSNSTAVSSMLMFCKVFPSQSRLAQVVAQMEVAIEPFRGESRTMAVAREPFRQRVEMVRVVPH